MKDQEKDGKAKQVTGRAKEAAGIVTGNHGLEQEGARQRAAGVIEENLGKARRKVGDFVEEVGKAIKK